MKHCPGVPPPALAFLREELGHLEADGLLRVPTPVQGLWRSFSSNDYLGLARRRGEGVPAYGAGASRLVSGNTAEHEALESEIASWLEVDAALVFTSGYAANVGLLSAVARPGDLVVSDALNHASIIDGARLSRARVEIVPHLDLAATEDALRRRSEARAWVVTESYFSMDADSPDLPALRRLCDERSAGLLLDEAHALGAFGPRGRGLAARAGVRPDATIGTFGKALGGGGAFVAGCADLRLWLWNRARSFVFSTGLSPATAASNLEALRLVEAGDATREALASRASQLRTGLRALGVEPLGFGHIVPWVIRDPGRAVKLAAVLRESGVVAQAIRPPSVPAGTARLRLTVSANHTADDVDRLLAAIQEALRCAR